MKKSTVLISLVLLLAPTFVKAQWTVYDPINYANALKRYYQLQQQLTQLRNTYTQVLAQYDLAVQMARSIKNMPARYQVIFSSWRNVTAPTTIQAHGLQGLIPARPQLSAQAINAPQPGFCGTRLKLSTL
jgi:hypothetical protein